MLAVSVVRTDEHDPLAGIEVGERPEPLAADGWAVVKVRAASLNHHDLWTLRGTGLLGSAPLPRILGSDAAGIDEDGNEVLVHSVVSSPGWHGDETLDPGGTMLSDVHDGTLAASVVVPRRNLVPKPAALSFEEAACLPTAWLTAYRMLFRHANVLPGATVLVQGAGGGVATAVIMLGAAAGLRVWATSRSEEKRARARALGAEQAFETGARLPERVDAVLETVGAATWSHSLKVLKPGGTIVLAGTTTGGDPPAGLHRIFMTKLRVVGTTLGTRDELDLLARFCAQQGIHPPIHDVLPLSEAVEGFRLMESGELFGKIVLRPPPRSTPG